MRECKAWTPLYLGHFSEPSLQWAILRNEVISPSWTLHKEQACLLLTKIWRVPKFSIPQMSCKPIVCSVSIWALQVRFRNEKTPWDHVQVVGKVGEVRDPTLLSVNDSAWWGVALKQAALMSLGRGSDVSLPMGQPVDRQCGHGCWAKESPKRK